MTEEDLPDPKDYSEALARGLRILTVFGPDAPSLTLAEVARRIGLPRATVRRALITLVHLGYMKEEGRQFHLTPRVMELAAAYLGASPATAILQPACEALAARHDQTFSVAILEGTDAVMIAYARPRRVYADSVGIGLRLPAYCSAVGRALLAGLPAGQIEAIIAASDRTPLTAKTVTDPARLVALVQQAAQDGFSIVEEEVEAGFRSMAVPVARLNGRNEFALNIGMSVSRGSVEEMRDTYLSLLRSEAALLRQQLT